MSAWHCVQARVVGLRIRGVAAAMFVVTACAAERLGPDLLVSMVHRALVTRLALGVGSLPGSAQRLRPALLPVGTKSAWQVEHLASQVA